MRSRSQTSSCPPAVKDPGALPAARALSLTVTPPSASELVSPGPTHERSHRAMTGRWFMSQITVRLEAELSPGEAPRAAGSSLDPGAQPAAGTRPPCIRTSEGGDATLAHALRSDKAQGLPGTHRTRAGARLPNPSDAAGRAVWKLARRGRGRRACRPVWGGHLGVACGSLSGDLLGDSARQASPPVDPPQTVQERTRRHAY